MSHAKQSMVRASSSGPRRAGPSKRKALTPMKRAGSAGGGRKRKSTSTITAAATWKMKRGAPSGVHWEMKRIPLKRRKIDLTLYHWVKQKEEVYYFDRHDKSCRIEQYTDEEYHHFCNDPKWSRRDTDLMMKLCKRFSLDFIIVCDRFAREAPSRRRSVEELKDRYYRIQRALFPLHNPGHNPKQAPIMRETYNFEHEVQRKRELEVLLGRPKDLDDQMSELQDQIAHYTKQIKKQKERLKKSKKKSKAAKAAEAKAAAAEAAKKKAEAKEEEAEEPVVPLSDHELFALRRTLPSDLVASQECVPALEPGVHSMRKYAAKPLCGLDSDVSSKVSDHLTKLKYKADNPLTVPTNHITNMWNDLRKDVATFKRLEAEAARQDELCAGLKSQVENAQARRSRKRQRRSTSRAPTRPEYDYSTGDEHTVKRQHTMHSAAPSHSHSSDTKAPAPHAHHHQAQVRPPSSRQHQQHKHAPPDNKSFPHSAPDTKPFSHSASAPPQKYAPPPDAKPFAAVQPPPYPHHHQSSQRVPPGPGVRPPPSHMPPAPMQPKVEPPAGVAAPSSAPAPQMYSPAQIQAFQRQLAQMSRSQQQAQPRQPPGPGVAPGAPGVDPNAQFFAAMAGGRFPQQQQQQQAPPPHQNHHQQQYR